MSAWHNVVIKLAADETPQAPTDADFASAGEPLSYATTKTLTVVSEPLNDETVPARVGGANVSSADGVGLPLQPSFERTLPAGGYFDVRNVYVSGKKDDLFNYCWNR